MSIFKSFFRGWGRALGSPGMLLWLWLINFAVALPATLVMTDALRSAIGPSMVHQSLRDGFDTSWYGELEHEAEGLVTTFTPTTAVGVAPFLDNLEAWLTGGLFRGFRGTVGLGVLYALLWALLLGGVLERFARPEGMFSAARLFAGGGRYFFRFLRLVAASGILYYLVYRLGRWLLGQVEGWTRDALGERAVLAWALAIWTLMLLLLTFVKTASDYGKIATVLENRRSALLALAHGARFVLAHPLKTFGLYALLGAVALALVGLWSLVAPGTGQASYFAIAVAFLLGQVFLILQLAVRLAAYGGQMALYESWKDRRGGF